MRAARAGYSRASAGADVVSARACEPLPPGACRRCCWRGACLARGVDRAVRSRRAARHGRSPSARRPLLMAVGVAVARAARRWSRRRAGVRGAHGASRAARQPGDDNADRARSSRRFSSPTRSAPTLEGRAAVGGRGAGSSRSSPPWPSLDPTSDDGLNLVWGWLVIVAAPVLVGRLLRDRARAEPRAARRRPRGSSAERAARARGGGAEERTRIAGELHDVVAHALQRDGRPGRGAARRLAERDPDAARAGVRRRRGDRPRGADRDPPRCSACCAARTRSWRSRRSRASRHVADAGRAARRAAGLPVDAARRRRGARRSRPAST